MATTANFKVFVGLDGAKAYIPDDITLRTPENSTLPLEQQHYLVYIPWDDKYLQKIPAAYRPFFRLALPHLNARTTDVHVAECMGLLPGFLAKSEGPINERVVAFALILHDIGWSQLNEDEVASSLGVTGLALNDAAVAPKEKHAVLGVDLAVRLLGEYVSRHALRPPLAPEEFDLIHRAILYHDKPWELAGEDGVPLEVQALCDLDHLWSLRI